MAPERDHYRDQYLVNKMDDSLSEIYMLRKHNQEIFRRLNELEKRMAQVTAIAVAIAVVIPVVIQAVLEN